MKRVSTPTWRFQHIYKQMLEIQDLWFRTQNKGLLFAQHPIFSNFFFRFLFFLMWTQANIYFFQLVTTMNKGKLSDATPSEYIKQP